MTTHGSLGQGRDSRDTTPTFHLAGLNTDRYRSAFAPMLIPREVPTAQEHKIVLYNSQGLSRKGRSGVRERGKHHQKLLKYIEAFQQGLCDFHLCYNYF